MRVFVFEFKVCTLNYFLDDMTFWEVNDIIDNIKYLDRNLLESQRLIAYIQAQANSTKSLNMTDIIKFPWDEEGQTNDNTITQNEIERLKEKAKRWEKEFSTAET